MWRQVRLFWRQRPEPAETSAGVFFFCDVATSEQPGKRLPTGRASPLESSALREMCHRASGLFFQKSLRATCAWLIPQHSEHIYKISHTRTRTPPPFLRGREERSKAFQPHSSLTTYILGTTASPSNTAVLGWGLLGGKWGAVWISVIWKSEAKSQRGRKRTNHQPPRAAAPALSQHRGSNNTTSVVQAHVIASAAAAAAATNLRQTAAAAVQARIQAE